MAQWEISKAFEFCYGHRVYDQQQDSKFTLDTCTSCKHLHGHHATIIVHLASNQLRSGLVCDAKHLNWFAKWISDVIDHKFIISAKDPLFSVMFPLATPETLVRSSDNYHTVDLNHSSMVNEHLKDLYGGLVIVPFIPTSENLSTWLIHIVQQKMYEVGLRVNRLEFFETPQTRCEFKTSQSP